MATFDEIVKKSQAMAARIAEATELDVGLVNNVVHYAKCLPLHTQPECIDELIFVAQMGLRFAITSQYHVQLMYEALRAPRTDFVTLEDYAKAICVFLSRDLDMKIDFVFRVYNFNRSGFITIPDIVQMLKNCILGFGDEDPAEQLKELIDMVVSVIDTNGDGMVSLEEFRAFVKHDILCLELFGKVLPNDAVTNSFRKLLNGKTAHKIKEFFVHERRKCLLEPTTKNAVSLLYPNIVLDMP